MWPGILLLCLLTPALQQEGTHLTLHVPETHVRAGDEGWILIKVEVKPGIHIQANELDEGSPLIATTLEVSDHKRIVTGKPGFPATVKFTLQGIDDEWDVYEGKFEINVPVRAHENLRKGKYCMEAELTYQACDNKKCFFPKTIPLQIRLIII